MRSRALSVFIISVLLIIHTCLFADSPSHPTPTFTIGVQVGMRIAEISLEDHQGVLRNLNDLIGKRPLFLYFYSGCCGHCSQELEKLSAMVQNIGTLGIDMVGVEYLGEKKSCHQNIEKFHLTGPVLADNGGKVCDRFGVGDFTVFILDTAGIIKYRGILPSLDQIKAILERKQ